jgi:hypothetical protein
MSAQAGDTPRCCWCGGSDVELVSPFGPTLMTQLYRCCHCNQDFEAVRWRLVAQASESRRSHV